MRDIFVEEPGDFPTTWVSPTKSHNLKSDFATFDVTQSPEYWQCLRSLAGSPFDSDSDSSSDCEDDAVSLVSSDVSSVIRGAPFSEDESPISQGFETLNIMEGNALGLVFMSKEDVLEAKAIATSTPQAKSLRVPPDHQDDHNCGRPNQDHHAQQERLAFQSDGPADDALAGRFPQDVSLWADVSDDSSPKDVHLYGDGVDQSDTYNHNPPGLRAPRMGTLSLPEEQEYEEDLLYSEPFLGGWLTDTLDGFPEIMSPGLSGLDVDLPVPFAMEN